MSKVQTLEKIISYKKEYPKATNAEISEACGISKRYLRKCKKEISELSFHLSSPMLQRSELDLILSKLDPEKEHERKIYDKLIGTYIGEKDGLIRMAGEDDLPSKEYLKIGLWAKEKSECIDFWLTYLLYDSLLWFSQEGEIDYRLASLCEEIDGYKKWRVLIRKDLNFSDGKKITPSDVIEAIKESNLTHFIKEVKKCGEREIVFTLFSSDPLFPYWLSYVPILPSHSSSLYSVTSGPFRLKKTKDKTTFRLLRREDYYKENHPLIDFVLLKTFYHSANAVKAVIRKELDFLPLRSLHQAIRVSKTVSPQSFPFRNLGYYLLLINKQRGPFTDESNVLSLKESIDYNLINLYFSASLSKEISSSPQKKGELASGPTDAWRDLKIGYLGNIPFPHVNSIVSILASSLSTSVLNIADMTEYSKERIREEADLIFTQLYFGLGYSRLRQFFQKEGKNNTFGFNYPFVDSLILELEKEADMRKRNAIGEEIISFLQEENAIILLAPCFEYFLSNLYLVPSRRINSLTSFILNLSNIYIERGKVKKHNSLESSLHL